MEKLTDAKFHLLVQRVTPAGRKCQNRPPPSNLHTEP